MLPCFNLATETHKCIMSDELCIYSGCCDQDEIECDNYEFEAIDDSDREVDLYFLERSF